MLISEEKLIEICEAVASGTLALSRAFVQCGVGRRTGFMWLQKSQAGDESFLIAWPGDQKIPFHRALSAARNMASLDVRGTFERRCLVGDLTPVFFQGSPTWVEDERCLGLDEDLRELLGYPRDGLLRDKFGRRIQHTIRSAPPVAAVVKFLEARFPDEYRQRSDTNVNVSGGLAVGVTAQPVQRLPSRADGPPAVPPPPRRPTIAAPINEAEFTEVEAGATSDVAPEPMAARATEPVVDDDAGDVFTPAPPAEPEVVIRETPPPAYVPTTNEATSDLARDLLARLRGDPLSRSANPVGSTKAAKPLGASE